MQTETHKQSKAKAPTRHTRRQTALRKQSTAGFLRKPVEHLEAVDEDNLKPTFKGWGGQGWGGGVAGQGAGNLTLSPQVSRFSQTRLRL